MTEVATRSQRARRRGRGEGSIYQRSSDGLWVGTVDLGYTNGKRRRKTVYGKTEKEVREKRKAIERARDAGQNLLERPRTLEQWLGEWLTTIKKNDIRPSTRRRYESFIQRHIAPCLGRARLDQVRSADLQKFLNEMSASGLQPATVRQLRAVLHVAFRDAARMNLISANPVTPVRAPRVPKQPVRALSVEEARRLLEAVASDRLQAFYVVTLALGLRRGESLGLTWDDVDLDQGTLRVARSLQRVDGTLTLVEPKSVTSHRTLSLPPSVVASLKKHQARQQAERLALGPAWPDTRLVFTSTSGTALEPRNVNRQWGKHRRAAGLDHVRIHDLRHGAATLLLAQGTHPRVIMEMLGHSQFGITMNTYAHVMPAALQDAAAAMEDALFA